MRHYEILLLVNPDQTNQIPAMLDRYLSIINKNGGKIHRNEDWGKLQLAYPIKKLYKAHYLLLNIECHPSTINELSNAFKFNDAVIRNLITQCEVAITEQSSFLNNRENDKKDYSNQSGSSNNNSSIEDNDGKFIRNEDYVDSNN